MRKFRIRPVLDDVAQHPRGMLAPVLALKLLIEPFEVVRSRRKPRITWKVRLPIVQGFFDPLGIENDLLVGHSAPRIIPPQVADLLANPNRAHAHRPEVPVERGIRGNGRRSARGRYLRRRLVLGRRCLAEHRRQRDEAE